MRPQPGVGPVDIQGTHDEVLTAMSTFTLTCQGYRGPTTKTVTVPVGEPTSLAAPTHLVATPLDGALSLSWSQHGGGTVVYFVAVSGIDASNVSSKPAGMVFRNVKNPFVISGLVNGTTYFARVSAVSGSVESSLSDEASGKPVDGAGQADPYFPEQWHLVNTGQERGLVGEDLHVPAAWASVMGSARADLGVPTLAWRRRRECLAVEAISAASCTHTARVS